MQMRPAVLSVRKNDKRKNVLKNRFKYLPLLQHIAIFFKSEKIPQLLQARTSDSEPFTIPSMSGFDVHQNPDAVLLLNRANLPA